MTTNTHIQKEFIVSSEITFDFLRTCIIESKSYNLPYVVAKLENDVLSFMSFPGSTIDTYRDKIVPLDDIFYDTYNNGMDDESCYYHILKDLEWLRTIDSK